MPLGVWRITHNWVERSKTRLRPERPPAPVYPADGGQSDGTDVVFQWNAATDPDGDAVTDYHFQLSDRPDMRWPISPNFDKYIGGRPTTARHATRFRGRASCRTAEPTIGM